MSTTLNAAMTPAGMAQLQTDEGLRLRVYDDATGNAIVPGSYVKGHPTIGIGRALDTNGISSLEAQNLFFDDIGVAVAGLSQYQWFQMLDRVRQDVLINMTFNLGMDGLLEFTDMLDELTLKNYPAAATAMLASDVARGPDSARYARLAEAMRTGSWPTA